VIDLQGYGWQLLVGVAVTLELAFTCLVCGLLLGMLLAGAKMSRNVVLRRVVTAVTNLIRGIPEFVILLICYFGLTNLIYMVTKADAQLNPFAGGVFALSLVLGCNSSETFRGAFLAVPHGQIEAGRAFGMRPVHVFLRIHLPQAWRVALPSLNNLWQNLLKDTSLVSVLGLQELMEKANIGAQVTRAPFTFFLVAAFLYLLLLAGSTPVFHALERFSSRGVLRR
jgi:putative lysine/arginine/ornithine/histidine/octopine transport system permease protein